MLTIEKWIQEIGIVLGLGIIIFVFFILKKIFFRKRIDFFYYYYSFLIGNIFFIIGKLN